MKKLSSQQIQTFQAKIFNWYAQNKRDLPWRLTHDPYKILVSEVMSQQTQIVRVIPKFEAWIVRFPDISTLGVASNADVLRYWSGLGYNRRALYLQKCAEEIVSRYQGKFPQSEEELLTLPGIGIYTARAVLSFAFEKNVVVIDTNVRKVILVEFKNYLPVTITNKDIEIMAEQLLPKENAYDWNQALMDYSSAVLKKEKISLKKQVRFKGSDRYYRGGIMRLLIKHKNLTIGEIHALLITEEKKEIESNKLAEILGRLVKDRLVKYDTNTQLYTL